MLSRISYVMSAAENSDQQDPEVVCSVIGACASGTPKVKEMSEVEDKVVAEVDSNDEMLFDGAEDGE